MFECFTCLYSFSTVSFFLFSCLEIVFIFFTCFLFNKSLSDFSQLFAIAQRHSGIFVVQSGGYIGM